MNKNKLTVLTDNIYLGKYLDGKSEITSNELIDILETYHGIYLAKVFLDEWRYLEEISKINKWEEEHGKSLALLFENETQRMMLSDLNEKLKEAASIYNKDMKMAATVQQSLLYKVPPVTKNYDIAFQYKPIASVSGDFYDFYVTDDQLLQGLVVADVSGHGIASALLTAIAKPIFFKLVRDNPSVSLGKIMNAVHQELIKEIDESSHYLTAILLRFPENKVEYVNAAHPEIIIKKARDNACHLVRLNDESISGPMIGLKAVSYDYESHIFEIEKDDILLIFTDCLSESFNAFKEEFGIDNVINTLRECPSSDVHVIIDHLLAALKKHTGNIPLSDDLTIIVLKKK